MKLLERDFGIGRKETLQLLERAEEIRPPVVRKNSAGPLASLVADAALLPALFFIGPDGFDRRSEFGESQRGVA